MYVFFVPCAHPSIHFKGENKVAEDNLTSLTVMFVVNRHFIILTPTNVHGAMIFVGSLNKNTWSVVAKNASRT
jgi:hypothetical protein